MASVVRFTSYTNVQAIDAVNDLPGIEAALLVVKVIAPAINAAANANVFTLKGAGKIQGIICSITRGGANLWSDAQNHVPVATISADSRSVNIAVPAGGTAILNTDIITLALIVGC